MLGTSARLLALLGLLQSRPSWTGTALAERLDVDTRTVRKDVARLRELGYPIDAVRGRHGGYRLGTQGQLPPLLLDDDEAVAVALGLGTVDAAIPGLAATGQAALAKLERTLPERLRRRVRALQETTDVGPANTGTNVVDPEVDAQLLVDLASAIRDRTGLRFHYREDERIEADPYRLVSWHQRWYVVARERPTGDWQAFRADWMRLRVPGASRFDWRPLEDGDYSAFVLRQVASTGWQVHARILVDGSAEEVLARINPAVGVVETVDDDHCVLVTGADSLEIVAVWIGMLGLDFHVEAPAELVEHVRDLAARYARALPG
ncbi:helix-turn-helix transcriptional regulator [Nocardioides currus]|uniref:DNA-binding transcriptional regulator n=1 Tax=Nocardioides currus TaxID=2133958 RepID=A0A2R7Z2Z7_9ACTN|nr:WYL domain-containing protein [Nocardioides currus]PUA82934.1 DNA-binding transcriptional regulator [Nocardioides currus]